MTFEALRARVDAIDVRALSDVDMIRVANLLAQLCGMALDEEDEALIAAFSIEADRLERVRP